MNRHYSDYQKKCVSIKDLTFDPVQDSDKDVLTRVVKAHARTNFVFIVLLSAGFCACAYYLISFLFIRTSMIFFEILGVLLPGAGAAFCGYYLYGFFGGITGIRRGVILTASRISERVDGRFAPLPYVVDIYMEDRDQTLMSYVVDRETFSQAAPGDGVIIAKIGRRIKVFADPDRKKVMDVSNIKSGID